MYSASLDSMIDRTWQMFLRIAPGAEEQMNRIVSTLSLSCGDDLVTLSLESASESLPVPESLLNTNLLGIA